MKDPVYIGIDPSLNSSGIVVLDEKGNPLNYESVNPLPLEGIQRLQHNYLRYKLLLSSYSNIRCISFERQVDQQRFNTNAKHILQLAENIGVLKLAIQESAHKHKQLTVLQFSPDQLKTFAVGKCRGVDKDQMMASLPKRILNAIQKHVPEYAVNDVTDAYYCAKMSHSVLGDGKYQDYLVLDC